jgi:hypothetical protein
MHVLSDEALTGLVPNGHDCIQKVHKTRTVTTASKEEINAILHGLHTDDLLVGVVLEDELLEVQEGTLMSNLLTDLSHSIPSIFGFNLATIRALLSSNDNFKDVRLLEDGGCKDLTLHSQSDLDTLTMGLGPQEGCIDETNLVEALDTLQTQRHQLLGFEGARKPLGWRLLVPFTATAKVDDDLFAALLGNVHTGANTVEAHVGRVGFNKDATFATKDLLGRRGGDVLAHAWEKGAKIQPTPPRSSGTALNGK